MAGLGKMFAPKAPKMPDPPAPTRMPTIADPDVQAAGLRTREAALKRKGRLSTILTDQTSATVGADYTRATLG
jgi:hypothetical protein